MMNVKLPPSFLFAHLSASSVPERGYCSVTCIECSVLALFPWVLIDLLQPSIDPSRALKDNIFDVLIGTL